MLKAFRLPKGVDFFTNFFDENPHLRVGGFEVDGEIVVAEAFAGCGADGRDDHLCARLFELCGGAILFE